MPNRATLLAVVFLAPPLLAQSVLVVDNTQGPGWQYATLQAAVDAAQPGDVLLVRGTDYFDESLEIIGKGITLCADVGFSVRLHEGVTVRDLPAGQTLVFRDLDLVPGTSSLNDDKSALRASNCAGAIRVEGCELAGSYFGSLKYSSPSFPAVTLDGCSSVVLLDCDVRGGAGSGYSKNGSGANAIEASVSTVAVFGSEVEGGQASGDGIPPRTGGTAVWLDESAFHAADSELSGGFNHSQPCGGGLCIEATSASVTLLGVTLAPGTCGPATSLTGSTLVELPGFPRRLALTSLVREGQAASLVVVAGQDELLFLLAALDTAHALALPLQAPLLVSPGAFLLVPLGSTGPFGAVIQQLTVGPLPAAAQGATVFCQAALMADDGPKLSNATTVVVLDESL